MDPRLSCERLSRLGEQRREEEVGSPTMHFSAWGSENRKRRTGRRSSAQGWTRRLYSFSQRLLYLYLLSWTGELFCVCLCVCVCVCVCGAVSGPSPLDQVQ